MQPQQEQEAVKGMAEVVEVERLLHQPLATTLDLAQVVQEAVVVEVLVATHLHMLLETMALQV
jgi:hypothetical protein